jgi:ribonuclease HI
MNILYIRKGQTMMAGRRRNIFSHESMVRIDKTELIGSPKKNDDNNIMLKNRAETLEQKIEKYKTHPVQPGICCIYTDGSTYNNGRKNAKSGYGVFFGHMDIPPISRPVPPMEKQTNNVAELMAIYAALEQMKDKVEGKIRIYSDSNYSLDVITGKKQAHTNLELIARIKKLKSACRVPIDFSHIYAHTDKQDQHSLGNDIADYLAGLGSK